MPFYSSDNVQRALRVFMCISMRGSVHNGPRMQSWQYSCQSVPTGESAFWRSFVTCAFSTFPMQRCKSCRRTSQSRSTSANIDSGSYRSSKLLIRLACSSASTKKLIRTNDSFRRPASEQQIANHHYNDLVARMKKASLEYPHITELYSIGKSLQVLFSRLFTVQF